MAREIAINMVIDTKTAESGVEKVNKSLQQTEKEIDKINSKPSTFSDRIKELDAQVDSGTLSMRQLSKVIQEYQTIALAAGRESPVGRQALEQAAQLRDKMVDLQNETKRLSHDRKNFQAAMQLSSTVVASYGAAQSAMVLLGTESEKTKEVFMRLQAAQTALVSIEQIRTALEKESFLMLKLNTMWTSAQTFATGLLAKAKLGDAAATGTATVATKAFTAALIATGIGAIVVALGLLIANFDKVSEVVGNAAKWVQGLAKKFTEMGAGMQILIGTLTFGLAPAISYAIKLFEELGVVETEEDKKRREREEQQQARLKQLTAAKIKAINKEIEAQKKLTEELSNAIDFEIAKKQAAGEDYSNLEQEKIRMLISSAKTEIGLINQKIKAKQKELMVEKDIFDFKAKNNNILVQAQIDAFDTQLEEQEKFLEEQFKALELWNIKQEKLQKDAIKKKSEDKKKANEKELEDEKKHQEDLLAAQLKAIADEEAVTDAYRKRQLTNEQKEIDDLQEKLYTELELAGENNELKLLLEEEYQSNVAAIRDKYRLQEEEAEQKQLELEEKQFQMLRELRQTEEENEIDRLITSYEDKFAIAMGNAELEKALEEQLLKDIAEIQDKYRKDEEVKDELTTIQKWEKRLDIAGQYTSALQGLTTHLFEFANNIGKKDEANTEKRAKRQFAITKALAISEASIDTGKAIVKAVASSAFPANLPAILFAATTGAAQIAAIASRQFSSGASSGGSAIGSITSGSVGRSDVGNQTDTTTNIEQLLNGNQGQGNQPVLVTDSLAKVQNKQAKIESLATL